MLPCLKDCVELVSACLAIIDVEVVAIDIRNVTSVLVVHHATLDHELVIVQFKPMIPSVSLRTHCGLTILPYGEVYVSVVSIVYVC